MPRGLNKKVLCFLDESGVAGTDDFCLGAVFLFARDAGRLDKCLSDELDAGANELHAVSLERNFVRQLLDRFLSNVPRDRLVMVNHKAPPPSAEAPLHYADAVVETVKIGLRRFRRQVLRRDHIGNVELILDANHHNTDAAFETRLAATRGTGAFRGVKQIGCIDSSASRLLQLADIVAHARRWSDGNGAARLHDRYGIHVS
jgi:hypothetical protein